MANSSVKKSNRNLVITIAVILIVAIIGSAALFASFYFFDYGKGEIKLDITEYTELPQNIILLIGDGMGLEHIKAGNVVTDNGMIVNKMTSKVNSKSAMNGEIVTRSLTPGVTDSAAAATTYATGNKTFNGRLSYLNGKDLTNMSEVVGATDMKFGVVATKSVTDATPAAFTSHSKSRSNAEEIALEQVNNANIDVLFGLGRSYFDQYASQINSGNRSYITSYKDLKSCYSDRVYGIFDDAIPTSGEFTLASLTRKAIDLLENDNGFFLMVEGSKIDSYSHNKDMDNMLEQLVAFNDAVSVAYNYAKTNEIIKNDPSGKTKAHSTLVIVLADHETGGLKIPDNASATDLNDGMFTHSGHTGANVGYFAYGPGATLLPAEMDNTDIFYVINQLLGLSA